MQGATANTIDGIAARTIPGLKIEFAVSFTSWSIQCSQPARQLVTLQEHAARVLFQQLPKFLNSGVMGQVARSVTALSRSSAFFVASADSIVLVVLPAFTASFKLLL